MADKPVYPNVHVTEIKRDEDGRRYEEVVSSPICDFCGDKDPKWDYDCDDFVAGFQESWGHWAACGPCSKMIESDDRQGLVDRNVSGWPYPPDDAIMGQIRLMQDGFFAHRIGERKAFG